ncbi:MAG: hypothetical protein O4751_15080 [Trichodesmium sp. St2_bin6]|nr:hypothetical protein [Trichodesmium sp. MAG_R01]MDE5071810.1 hypothetical protein [Trichodesmium sp. St5_bin8]MDE5079510.1 hypothetical protein [Trichodesmium sp. St2_bin6]
MSYPKKLPNSIRYFRARFSHLTKLSVWGPIGVVSLVLLFVWELSMHPEWLTLENDDNSVSNGNTISENLSAEEISMISDIDNLSVLIEELKINKKLLINPLLSYQKNSLYLPQKYKQKNVINQEQDLVDSMPEINIYGEGKTKNFYSRNQLQNSKLSTSPLLRSMNLLDQANQEETRVEPVYPLKNAMDNYLSSKGKSESPSNYNSQSSNFNLYPTEIKPRDITSSPIINSSKSNLSKSEERNNYNPPLPSINVTPPKPYYTNLSGVRNQTNKQTNLPGYNDSLVGPPIAPNLPPLTPVVPLGLANNKNGVDVVNNLEFPHSYNNQGYRQNQPQYYYQVNPNQNQNVLATPSSNPFYSRNNSFYNSGYNQRWNNPFRE